VTVVTLKTLDFKVNYVKLVKAKPRLVAEIQFWQYIIYGDICRGHGERMR